MRQDTRSNCGRIKLISGTCPQDAWLASHGGVRTLNVELSADKVALAIHETFDKLPKDRSQCSPTSVLFENLSGVLHHTTTITDQDLRDALLGGPTQDRHGFANIPVKFTDRITRIETSYEARQDPVLEQSIAVFNKIHDAEIRIEISVWQERPMWYDFSRSARAQKLPKNMTVGRLGSQQLTVLKLSKPEALVRHDTVSDVEGMDIDG